VRGGEAMQGRVLNFGGTGCLGRRIVEHLLEVPEFEVRIAVRHPERAAARDGLAAKGSDAVVNAVSL